MKSGQKHNNQKSQCINFLKEKHNILQVEDSQDSILVQTLLKVANALTFHQWKEYVKRTKQT